MFRLLFILFIFFFYVCSSFIRFFFSASFNRHDCVYFRSISVTVGPSNSNPVRSIITVIEIGNFHHKYIKKSDIHHPHMCNGHFYFSWFSFVDHGIKWFILWFCRQQGKQDKNSHCLFVFLIRVSSVFCIFPFSVVGRKIYFVIARHRAGDHISFTQIIVKKINVIISC